MSANAASYRVRGIFLLILPLAFGTVGWEHIYHSVVLGTSVEGSVAGHLEQVLRDGLLALPLALVAVVGGLWFGRRLSLPGRARGRRVRAAARALSRRARRDRRR
jgi:hypothetical protein